MTKLSLGRDVENEDPDKPADKPRLCQGFVSQYTVNSEIFARILFLQIALKDIFATLKITTRA